MVSFVNHSVFPALRFEGLDQHDIGFDIVVARVTYDLDIQDARAALERSAQQASLVYCDEHYGDPVATSVRYESDLAPYKPRTDVVINATAFAPHGMAALSFDVTAAVGPARKTLRIHGPRLWKFGLSGWALGRAAPIGCLDIRYERACGGCYQVEERTVACADNPIGIGWYPAEYLARCEKIELPAAQIESADSPIVTIDEPTTPAGFGFFGKSWHGRIEFGGTYDSKWLEERHPYLPKDFDFRYWCGTHPSLQIAHPRPGGNVPVSLHGLVPASEVPDQRIAFDIPVETLFVYVKSGLGFGATKDMALDTIVIDMHERRVFCSYRIALAKQLEATEIQLRYLPAHERQRQTALAAAMLDDPSSPTFLPLPPSLMKKE